MTSVFIPAVRLVRLSAGLPEQVGGGMTSFAPPRTCLTFEPEEVEGHRPERPEEGGRAEG